MEERKEKKFAEGVIHVERKELNGKPTDFIYFNATPLVIQITDGKDTVQLGHFDGGAIIVPGNIHQFANLLSIWANNLLTTSFPPVVSEVYEELGLLEELQNCTDRYIEESRWGSFYGRPLEHVRRELWNRFKKNLDPYLTGQALRNKRKSFMDALHGALTKYRQEQIRRI